MDGMLAVGLCIVFNGMQGRSMGITIFTAAPYPNNEARRSDAAKASRLLDRVGDPRLNRIATEARETLNARWSGVCVVIGDTQHVVASSGGMLGMYRRSTALSGYVVSEPGGFFDVLDAAADERFAGNPFVADGLIGFYAGAAIMDEQGFALGALCITDRHARQSFSGEEKSRLVALSARISEQVG